MKRVVSACIEQILFFENEQESENYLRYLARKHIQYRVVEQKRDENGLVKLYIKRAHNHYPVGDYLEEA